MSCDPPVRGGSIYRVVESAGGPTAGSPGEGERSEGTTAPPDASADAVLNGSAIHAGLAKQEVEIGPVYVIRLKTP